VVVSVDAPHSILPLVDLNKTDLLVLQLDRSEGGRFNPSLQEF